MGGKKDGSKDVEAGLESARRELSSRIDEREMKAREKLDTLLSEKDMEFCSKCGKVVRSRNGWGGRCVWEGCQSLLCRECWGISKYRFCKRHTEGVTDERDGKSAKREAFAAEDEPRLNIDIKAALDSHEESRLEKIRYYASEYARFVLARMEKDGPIDWTPERYMAKPVMESGKEGLATVVTVSEKKWFLKRKRLSVVIMPYDARGGFDASSLNADVRKAARSAGGYSIVVLVSDGSPMELMDFVNRFSDSEISLFLAEPKKGHLNFNIKSPATTAYSEWFSQKKDPRRFRERLRAIGELVSGRRVISASEAAKEFGFREKDAEGILRSCDFLSHLKDTDTFILGGE